MTETNPIEETELDENNVYSVPAIVVTPDNIAEEREQEERIPAPSGHYVEVTNIIPVTPARQPESLVVEPLVPIHNFPCPAYSEISANRRETSDTEIQTLELIQRINESREEIKEKILLQARYLRLLLDLAAAERAETKKLQALSQRALLVSALIWIAYLLTEAIFLFVTIVFNPC